MKIAVISPFVIFPGKEWPWMDDLYYIQNCMKEFSESLWKVLERHFEKNTFDQVVIYLSNEHAFNTLLRAHKHRLNNSPKKIVFCYAEGNSEWILEQMDNFGFKESRFQRCSGPHEVTKIALSHLRKSA